MFMIWFKSIKQQCNRYTILVYLSQGAVRVYYAPCKHSPPMIRQL